jgi:hypothetical protein
MPPSLAAFLAVIARRKRAIFVLRRVIAIPDFDAAR